MGLDGTLLDGTNFSCLLSISDNANLVLSAEPISEIPPIPIPGVPPEAIFSALPLSGAKPLTVSFTDKSFGFIDTWTWDFGDGNTSTLQNPTHTFDFPGVYSVSLTVTGDSVSDTETKNNYITVVSPNAPDLSCKVKEFHCIEFGQKIVLKLQIENSGNTKAEPFDVVFYPQQHARIGGAMNATAKRISALMPVHAIQNLVVTQ